MDYFGYARVSTKEQNLDRQINALLDFGVKESYIYVDKLSGRDFNRPSYRAMVRRMRRGDVLVAKSIDRLGRDYDDIQEQWRHLSRDRELDIVILDMPLLDTRRREGGLTGVFISDMVLQILSYVADMERKMIKQRQMEGIAAAMEKGVRFGRPPMEIPGEFRTAARKYIEGKLSSRMAAERCGISQTTFLRWIKREFH